jgi:hypothetical protein
VIGAGAAGLMAALHAAGGNHPVVLLETTSDGGRKILISGGGRCNVLPARFDPSDYVTDSSPHILRNVLRSFPDAAQRRFFEQELRLPLALETETGKLFPVSNRARDVRDRLVAEVRARGVELRFNQRVTNLLAPPEPDGGWDVRVADAPALRAHAVILASGGLSVPATGSDGAGLRIVRALGHTVRETYPALTPLTLEPARFAALAGVSLTVTIRAPLRRGTLETQGGFLFTHRGYSGPAVLNVSHAAVRARAAGGVQPLHVQWSELDEAAWAAQLTGSGTLEPQLRRELPARLVDLLLQEARLVGEHRLAQLSREERRRLLEVLVRFPLPHTGDEGYRKAEVTGGGVALEEIDARTLQSRIQPRLFLCGELLDAFGPIGGYNFAWAWATGRLAGLAARAS